MSLEKTRKIIGRTPPPYGGVSNYNQNLIHALNQKNIRYQLIDPTLFSFYNLELGYFDSYNSIVENPSLKNIIRYIPFILKDKNVIKVIHAGDFQIKLPHFSRLQRFLIKRYLKNCSKIICVSEELRKFISDSFQIKNLCVVSSLLPYFNTTVTSQTKRVFNQIASLSRTRIVGIGVFNEFYGFQNIIDALSPFAIEKKIHLILIDGGFTNNAGYRNKCLKSHSWITVLEQISSSDVHWIMKQSDLFIRSVEKESFGLSKVEAIINGTNVISTNTGYTRDIPTYQFGDVRTLSQLIRNHINVKTVVNGNSQSKLLEEMENNLNSLISIAFNQ